MTADEAPIRPRRGRPPGIKNRSGFGVPSRWTEDVINRLGEIASPKQIKTAQKYIRSGRVIELSISPGLIEAKVQGRRRTPYAVRLCAHRPDDAAIGSIVRCLREKAVYKAALMGGEIPPELGDIFQTAGVTLSLKRFTTIQRMCGCPERGLVCEHILSAVYMAGMAFDRDPFLLMKLRGLDKKTLLDTLCAPVGVDAAPLCDDPDDEDLAYRGVEDSAPGESADTAHAGFYGSRETLPRGTAQAGSPRHAPLPDFPLWRGDAPFADSIAPYYRMVKKFIESRS